MTNKPYVKKFCTDQETGLPKLLNPITKENPYLHQNPTTSRQKRAFKYVIVRHAVTGAWIGEVKRGGNNRKPCKRTGLKRSIHFS